VSYRDLLESVHKALHSAGVSQSDTHFYLDWIEDEVRREKQDWWAWMGVATVGGFTAGALMCVWSPVI
jgi:hypothetical protein